MGVSEQRPARILRVLIKMTSSMGHLSPLSSSTKKKKEKQPTNQQKPTSWFWKLCYYLPKEAGQSSHLPGCLHRGEDAQCRRRPCGEAAEGCLPPLPCSPASLAATQQLLCHSLYVAELKRLLPASVCPEPQGRVAEAGRNVPRKGISFADNAFDVAKLQAPSPGVGG